MPLKYGNSTARAVPLLGLDVVSFGESSWGGRHPKVIPLNGKDLLNVLDIRCSVLVGGNDIVSSIYIKDLITDHFCWM